jgi:hypothetical protein
LSLPRQKTGVEGILQHEFSTAAGYHQLTIDEYLRKRLMPVEGAVPHLAGIEMYGNSIPAGTVGGDVFEYINFQQRYDIDARIQRALQLSTEFLEPLRADAPPRNSVDDHVEWLKSRPGFRSETETEYRTARSSEQVRAAADLEELYTTAGVLLVDAHGHGIISAKIALTVHDTFHALMLAELDRRGKTTPDLFEKLNLRLAQSVTARILVWLIGLSLGGTTGYAINPARDFGPRLAHAVLPVAGKGTSDWSHAVVPILGPLIAGGLGGLLLRTIVR